MNTMSFDVKYATMRHKSVIFTCIETLFENAGLKLSKEEFDRKVDSFDARYTTSQSNYDIYTVMEKYAVKGKVVLYVYDSELYLLIPNLY